MAEHLGGGEDADRAEDLEPGDADLPAGVLARTDSDGEAVAADRPGTD
ncbi:hypothetical protein [Actinomadura logoneensis]|nr:hypothetical protein [Actinomadura logoneensis]